MSDGIPVYIIARDTLSTIWQLVHNANNLTGVDGVTVIDSGSTYLPLREWYNATDDSRNGDCMLACNLNEGPHRLFGVAEKQSQAYGHKYHVVTDGDLDISEVPADVLLKMRDVLDARPEILKVGLSLRIDDLPAYGPLSSTVIAHESQFWQHKLGDLGYLADIDTTFAMYRVGSGWGGYGPSIRLAPPYCARHVSWYLDPSRPETIPPDWRHYLTHCDRSISTWGNRMIQIVEQNGGFPNE